MLEIKVQCDCGQRYKFDVEPVNGRMPFTVACPLCGVDGTAKANELLAAAPPPVPMHALASAEPAQVASPSASSLVPPVPAPSAGRLKLNRAEPQAAEPVAAAAPPPVPTRVPVPHRPGPIHVQATPVASGKKPSFALGFLGAVIGALVGAGIYFLLFKYAGLKIKLIAVGVGYLSGMGAEWMGRKEGSKELGMIAGALTLAAIIGAQYFVTLGWWKEEAVEDAEVAAEEYQDAISYAKEVVKAIPNGTDQEIRLFLAKEDLEPEEQPDLASITDEDVKDFRENELPEFQALASGKMTQQEYEKALMADASADTGDEEMATAPPEDDEGDFKAFFLLFLLSKVNLVSLAAAVGLAFKLCSNA